MSAAAIKAKHAVAALATEATPTGPPTTNGTAVPSGLPAQQRVAQPPADGAAPALDGAPAAPAAAPPTAPGNAPDHMANGDAPSQQQQQPQQQQQQPQQDQLMPDGEAAPPSADAAANGVSSEDIQLVQNLIERCLQLYMTRDEVIHVLKDQATIESRFTQVVWQKLEEQNPEFFRCYYTRLKLKAQIVTFNHLLEQQVQVVQRMQRGWMAGGMSASATASGIPLFQGGGGGMVAGAGDGQHRPGGRDQVVPDPHGEDFAFPSLDTGPSPLFGALPHIGSEPDLANLGTHYLQTMPTPGELEHSLTFLPTTSPLNAHAAAHLGDLELVRREGGGGAMRRNFSLSELAHLDAGGNPSRDGRDVMQVDAKVETAG